MTVIVLLGAPGAGKGTQAQVLRERLDMPHIATGDLFREAFRLGTAIGREARRYMDRGQLVPDEITIRMLLDRLDEADATTGAILDGFPRTRAQAEALDAALAERGAKVDRALLIDVPADDLIRRMAGRWICEQSGHVYHATANPPRVPGRCDIDGSALIQRADDEVETVRARFAEQLGALTDVIEYYRGRGILRTVDGRQSIRDVTAALLAELDPPVRQVV
ncbi:MAG TPA: adenylate kinase [Candidatus Limnocylindrales bacterium]|nr:adenylate kinase [Candidatus Limnocylindrales bacterium]